MPWGLLLSRLARFYDSGDWRVPVLRERGADPFTVMVSTILSQRTRDEVTQRSTVRLLTAYPDCIALSQAPVRRVETLIREAGLWKMKAKGLRDAARALVERHDRVMPRDEQTLLGLPMVGPKTAHAIIVFGHQDPGLPIDTHILRVTRRLGAVKSRTIRGAQVELAEDVPTKYWSLLNPLLVQHGQNICKAPRPRCWDCPISTWCLRVGVPLRWQENT